MVSKHTIKKAGEYMQEAINKTEALKTNVQEFKAPFMTAKDISKEIFGGNLTARHILDRVSKQPGFPSPIENIGKKFWRRSEIMEYYRLTEEKKAA